MRERLGFPGCFRAIGLHNTYYATCDPERRGEPEQVAAILPRVWADLLRRWTWDWFVTLTFKDPVHPEQARKHFDRWLRGLDLERRALGYFEQDGIVRALGIERQQRGVLHFHVLLSNVGELRYQVVRDHWRRGHSWVQRVRGAESVTAYVAKYVAKGGEVDLDDCGVTNLKGIVARWPARVYARSQYRRAVGVLSAEEQKRAMDWATRDRGPSTRPDELLARARAAAERPKASGRVYGPELDGSEPQKGS